MNNSIFAAALKSNDSVAQLVEQYTFNVWALGSNPSGITKYSPSLKFRVRSRFGFFFSD